MASSQFVFQSYSFELTTGIAFFSYRANGHEFCEKVTFADRASTYDEAVLDRALQLAFLVIGTSYFKAFPSPEVKFEMGAIDAWQADFLNNVYQEGMSQFAYENSLSRDDLAHFTATTAERLSPLAYKGEGILALQSGGKDSLLSAVLLEDASRPFTSLYVASGDAHPSVLDNLPGELVTVRREIDIEALRQAISDGGLNGHVPVTFIVLAIAVIQAVLRGDAAVVASIGHEGEEPHAHIGDLSVAHQWSKTWSAEQLFAEYISRYISTDIKVGSPLRGLSELMISKLFAERVWQRFGRRFSSCNRANYEQGTDNSHLAWCGDCPKCANAFLLFAPFVETQELRELFGDKDLFASASLNETFKGLLGIDGVMKPFECVGEIDELRYAYHLSDNKGYGRLPFDVPAASFDFERTYPAQEWATRLAGTI